MTTTAIDSKVCVITHNGPHGFLKRGQVVSANHVAVREYPNFFVDFGTPDDLWPSEFDSLDESRAERERQRNEEIRREFERMAKLNPRRLEVPDVVELKRDILCTIDGIPTKLLRASRVLATNPLVSEFPNEFKAV